MGGAKFEVDEDSLANWIKAQTIDFFCVLKKPTTVMAAELLAGDRADILLDCLQDLGYASMLGTRLDAVSPSHRLPSPTLLYL